MKELNIDVETMGHLLTLGKTSAKVRDLLRAKNTINSYILNKSVTEDKFRYYAYALDKIDEYLANRHLRLFEENLVSKQGYDKRLWDDDKLMAYHVISLLCRDLGFDPLTFTPLDPQIFDKDSSTGLFARHHLDIRRKFSLYLQDLLLTDNVQHQQYDHHIPLSDQKILVQIIQDLIQNDGSGPNKEIKAKDVVNTFLSNFGDPNTAKFYLENYWLSGDFQDNLNAFNERKNMIKTGDFKEYIRGNYKNAFGRFFDNGMDIINSLTSLSIIKCPSCNKHNKDMTYHKKSRSWYCVDCYKKNFTFTILKGSSE